VYGCTGGNGYAVITYTVTSRLTLPATGSYTYTGDNAPTITGSGATYWNVTLPTNASVTSIQLYGGGGGGEATSTYDSSYDGGANGNVGMYTLSTMALTTGVTYRVYIGSGGVGGSANYNNGTGSPGIGGYGFVSGATGMYEGDGTTGVDAVDHTGNVWNGSDYSTAGGGGGGSTALTNSSGTSLLIAGGGNGGTSTWDGGNGGNTGVGTSATGPVGGLGITGLPNDGVTVTVYGGTGGNGYAVITYTS
jgi:hypothetical protein